MKTPHRHFSNAVQILALCAFSFCAIAADSTKVSLIRTPDGGIQPQATMDRQGVIHLIYYKGDA